MFLIYCTSVCICYQVAAFAIPFDMQHDNVLKKLNFNLLTPRALGGGVLRGKNLLPCFRIHDSIQFGMQSDHILEKLNFDLSTPESGDGGEQGSAGKIFATMLLHSSFPLM